MFKTLKNSGKEDTGFEDSDRSGPRLGAAILTFYIYLLL